MFEAFSEYGLVGLIIAAVLGMMYRMQGRIEKSLDDQRTDEKDKQTTNNEIMAQKDKDLLELTVNAVAVGTVQSERSATILGLLETQAGQDQDKELTRIAKTLEKMIELLTDLTKKTDALHDCHLGPTARDSDGRLKWWVAESIARDQAEMKNQISGMSVELADVKKILKAISE